VCLATLVLLTCQCAGGRSIAERTIFAFVDAVQSRNTEALFCLLAGAYVPGDDPEVAASGRADFDAWIASRLDAYLSERDSGFVDLGDDGVALTLAFALGRGTYYTLLSVDGDGADRLVADTEVRFAYADIDISGLPPGTVMYFCGSPLGAIRTVTVPAGSDETREEVLETVVVRWTLVREPETPACPGGWKVASAVPLAGTVETRQVSWVF
jgi:hypothetical protein